MSDNDLEVSVGGGNTLSGDFMSPGQDGNAPAPKVTERSADGTGMDFNPDGTVESTAQPPAQPAGEEPKPGEGEDTAAPEDGAEEAAEGEQEGAEEEAKELPSWDPENEEAAKAWDERFFPGDGTTLNTEGFAAELEANMSKEGGKAELNADSYAYLNDRLGVSKDYVDQIIAGQLAVRAQNKATFEGMAGDMDVYNAKVDWGTQNFTAAQKEAFNAALASGDVSAVQEQLDLLDVRMTRAGVDMEAFAAEAKAAAGNTSQPTAGAEEGAAKAPVRRGPPARNRRPSSPPKPAAASTPVGGGEGPTDGFKDNNEYVAALKAATNDAERREVAAKLRRSTFWKGR